jgi:hypothetical protein
VRAVEQRRAVSTSVWRASISHSSSANWRSVAAMICWYSTDATSGAPTESWGNGEGVQRLTPQARVP